MITPDKDDPLSPLLDFGYKVYIWAKFTLIVIGALAVTALSLGVHGLQVNVFKSVEADELFEMGPDGTLKTKKGEKK